MSAPGEYETHLTVAVGDPELPGWKPVRIELSAGAHAVQPMLTRRAREPLADTRRATAEAVAALTASGFLVVRVKVEAAPGNIGVPVSDADAAADPPGRYWEHHVKLLLPPGADPMPVAARHAARLSRNARRVRADGRAERFLTQRCHRVGRGTSGRALAALLADLQAGGFVVLDAEQEYVLSDTNLALDAGWLEDHP
jgi:hypothetical protein